MKRSRYTEEQIMGILKEQEAGTPVAELCRKHGMSDATFYTWKSKYGALSRSEGFAPCPVASDAENTFNYPRTLVSRG